MSKWQATKDRRKTRSRELYNSVLDVVDQFCYDYVEGCYHESEAEKNDAFMYLQIEINQLDTVKNYFRVTPKMRKSIENHITKHKNDIYQIYNNIGQLVKVMGFNN
jgi:hypothetical protein